MKTYIDILKEGNEGAGFRDVVDNLDEQQFIDAAEDYHQYKLKLLGMPVDFTSQQVLAWEKWKVEKGNYPEYRTQEQMIKDYLSQLHPIELKINRMEEITIYKFQLESIKEALRITANIHDSRNKLKEGETCHDRMVRQAEKYAENALVGEKNVQVRRF
tara:strand:+ start:2824 stop:3300 length:477 start_codon:yes stop_codon:yes gene_type:complete